MKNIPIPVWIITLYFGLTSLLGLFTYSSYLLGFGSDNPQLIAVFSSYGAFDYILIILKQILVISGCYFLFRLKKQAVLVFLAVLIVAAVSLVWFSFKTDVIANTGWLTFLIVNVGIGLGLWGAVLLYSKKLIKKGVLV